MDTNEKLKFIGLDVNNLPERITNFTNINFRIKRNYNEKSYKIYKFINIADIDIYLTPTHRLTEYTEKYAKALPLYMYLNPTTEEDMERYTEFLNLIKKLQIEDINEIEKEQKNFNEKMPVSVKYHKDYLWQIYYSEDTRKYFMLFPTKENDASALFYVLKKQIENKNEQIYVPICYSNYSRKYLLDSEIEDLETYLCFFTKEWPLVYEVYDKENNMQIEIVGRTYIYDNIKSEYKVTLRKEIEAQEFYKLIKALFILETQLSHYYKFKIKLDRYGFLNFYKDSFKFNFENLLDFIKQEYIKGIEIIIKAKEANVNLTKELKSLKNISTELNEEYYEKEKQISTFLECKKTFLGKIKYFFKYKKTKLSNKIGTKSTNSKEHNGKLKYCERPELREHYTLEELIKLYETLDIENNEIRNLEQDIEALNKRIEILNAKIKNANQYIKEIDEHKKSIFEFWKFTNKDELKKLRQGTEIEYKKNKIKKVFNLELDLEDVSKQFDRECRKIYDLKETNYIHIATTNVLEDLNLLAKQEEIPEEHLQNLKETNNITAIDIFGSIVNSREHTETLGNIKHRENEKNKLLILHINESTTLEEYKDMLKEVLTKLQNLINKFRMPIEIPVYKTGTMENELNIFYINPEEAIKKTTKKTEELHKIILKENTECIPLTNIMYYNNDNQTLPLGMNITSGILLNTEKLNLKEKTKEYNYKINFNEINNKIESTKYNIYEYEIQE